MAPKIQNKSYFSNVLTAKGRMRTKLLANLRAYLQSSDSLEVPPFGVIWYIILAT